VTGIRNALRWLLVGVLVACTTAEAPREVEKIARPNVVLITIDTLRHDHTTPYGYALETTPELAKLARDGARFDTAYAHTPTTGPSHATMLTARLPIGNGAVRNGASLSEEVPTLAEILKDQGYQTAAFVSSYVLSGKFGFERGFERYDGELAQAPGDRELTAAAPIRPSMQRSSGWRRIGTRSDRCSSSCISSIRTARTLRRRPSRRGSFPKA
jgi:arylsulfatase A-like enzyme